MTEQDFEALVKEHAGACSRVGILTGWEQAAEGRAETWDADALVAAHARAAAAHAALVLECRRLRDALDRTRLMLHGGYHPDAVENIRCYVERILAGGSE